MKAPQGVFPGQGSSGEHHWSQFGQPSGFNCTHTQRVLLGCLHELIENNALGFLATEHRRRMDVHDLFAVQDFVATCTRHTEVTLRLSGVYNTIRSSYVLYAWIRWRAFWLCPGLPRRSFEWVQRFYKNTGCVCQCNDRPHNGEHLKQHIFRKAHTSLCACLLDQQCFQDLKLLGRTG